MNRAPRPLRIIATGVCIYETVALWSDLPTLTEIAHRHPLAGKMMQTWVDNHFSAIREFS